MTGITRNASAMIVKSASMRNLNGLPGCLQFVATGNNAEAWRLRPVAIKQDDRAVGS